MPGCYFPITQRPWDPVRGCEPAWDQQNLNEGQENAYHSLVKDYRKVTNETESHQGGPSSGTSHQYMH